MDIKLEDLSGINISSFNKRNAVRSLIFDQDENIALCFVSCEGYYKIPGGGVEKEEDLITALKRECKEEAGVEIANIIELGYIREYRLFWNQIQDSYCYISSVSGEKKLPEFTESEKEKGFQAVWFPLDEAVELMEKSSLKMKTLPARYMSLRDLTFVKEYKRLKD